MNLNEERLKSDLHELGGSGTPMPTVVNNTIVTEIDLRDKIAMSAQFTLQDGIEAWQQANSQYRTAPTYGEIYSTLSEMRYAYADAMLAERAK